MLGRTYSEFLDFLQERGVDYAPGSAAETAADEATLRWLDDRSPDDRGPR